MNDQRIIVPVNPVLVPPVSGSTDVYLILGDPVEQVLAPEIFNPLFARFGHDALLVPNAALRFTPAATKSASSGGFVANLFPRGPQQPKQVKENTSNNSTTRTLWVLQDNKPTPVEVTVGLTDGRRTQIVSGDLKAGARVIIGMQKVSK